MSETDKVALTFAIPLALMGSVGFLFAVARYIELAMGSI